MGLFSSKKKIYVSSTLYNLAGDIDKRIQYLPSTIATKVVAGTAPSIGETIQDALLNGPGLRFRSYARWARTQGYSNSLGITQGVLNIGKTIDPIQLAATIPHGADETVIVQSSEIGIADYGFWADQWMLTNHPEKVDSDYELDFDELANLIVISFADGTVYQFSPVNYDSTSRYLYVSYILAKQNQLGPLVPGSTVSVSGPSQFPSTIGWTSKGTVTTPRSLDLVTTVKTEVTYSDNTPGTSDTTNSTRIGSYSDTVATYAKQETANTDTKITITNHTLYLYTTGHVTSNTDVSTKTEEDDFGVVKTTVTTTTTESIEYVYAYKEDTQDEVVSSWSTMQVIIYKNGDGNSIYDSFFAPSDDAGAFVPFIPVRQWGTFISETYQPDLYVLSQKAIKRSMNKKYDYLVNQLKDNESLDDIDFAYVVFGVPLNTKENASRKYIYKFFQMLHNYGAGDAGAYATWQTGWANANNSQLAWVAWRDAQGDAANPLNGTAEPRRIAYPQMPLNYLRTVSSVTNFNMVVAWGNLDELVLSGLGKPDAKIGDVWLTLGVTKDFTELMISAGIVDTRKFQSDVVSIFWQDKANSYRVMVVNGLFHENVVYKGKNVRTEAPDAFSDPDESGFIIPLHEGVFKAMSLKDATQMSTSCAYMVLNSYKVVKQKWYQSGFFKIVLVVAAIVVTIYSGGSASASLTAAAAIGTSALVTTIISLVASYAVNALVAMLITQLFTKIASSLLGPKIGAIVGAVAAVAAISIGTSLAGGGTAAQGLTNMATAPNLLKMTVAASNGIQTAMQSELSDIQKQIEDVQKNYKTESASIMDIWAKTLGLENSTIDPTQLTNAVGANYENLDTFLSRTLLLGSDIAELTNGLIGTLTDYTLSTDLPV